MRLRLAWLTGLLLLAFVSTSCGRRPFADGSSRDLTLVTTLASDSPEIVLLRGVIERTAVRIDDEKAYAIRVVRPDDADAYAARNVVVVGHGPAGDVPGPARGLYGRLPRDPVTPFVFRPDVWRRGQAAGIVWTKTAASWVSSVSQARDSLFHALDRATLASVRDRVRLLPRDPAAEEELRRALGIRMAIPLGMTLTLDPPHRAALLRDEGPPRRLIRIAVAPVDSPIVDPFHAREALARIFRPDEVTLDVAEPLLSADAMAGAVRQLHGRWQDASLNASGPYRYYEIERGRLRVQVDLAVFAPGKAKLPYLRELHVLAETIAPS